MCVTHFVRRRRILSRHSLKEALHRVAANHLRVRVRVRVRARNRDRDRVRDRVRLGL